MTTNQMQERLEQAYPGDEIQVVDTTGGGSNFQVMVQSSKFNGKTRIQQHKEIMSVFDVELKSGEVHALTIKTITK